MATLELDCPGCDQTLELDAGFAGGVCRCSHCGTLMTVPSDTSQGAEKLSRPDRPDRPDAPGPARPESPGQRSTEADDVEVEAQVDGEAEAEATGDATQTYTTASGQTVRLDQHSVPTAAPKKRPMVRAVTAGVIVAVLAGLVGLVGFALMTVMGGGDDGTPTGKQAAVDQFGYDPSVNIYTLEEPNVLGLPLGQTTAIVVDASGNSRDWLGLVQDAVRVGVMREGGAGNLGLVYAKEAKPLALSDKPTSLGDLTTEKIHAFQDPIAAAGVAPLAPAVERAMKWSPDKLILVTGQMIDSGEADAIAQTLGDNASVTVVVVLINRFSDAAKQLAESRGGRFVELSSGQLTRWYRSADVPRP